MNQNERQELLKALREIELKLAWIELRHNVMNLIVAIASLGFILYVFLR
jgi:hypothetical protein